MSDRLCAWLLRLYPSGFRKKYREEALQLYRDRLRDETGVYLKARLHCDLLMDALAGLPQAWRNSRVGSSRRALVTHSDGIPSFQVLDEEPLRPATIFLGSTVSFTALAAFGILITHPPPLPMISPDRPLSPVESVMERLNHAKSRGSEDQGATANGSGAAGTPQAQSVAGMPQAQSAVNAYATVSSDSSLLLDRAERDRVIHGVAGNLLAHYFDRQRAQDASEQLLIRENRGEYDAISDGPTLAAQLTADVRSSTGDRHLVVEYSRNRIPDRPSRPSAAALEQYRAGMLQQNCMVESTQISRTLGYVKLNSFPDLSICGARTFAAMDSLSSSKALIIDLRENTGGFPDTVAAVASRLFAHPVAWYNPRATPSAGMLSPAPGTKLGSQPLYILTSSITLSGAEQFTYNMKMLHRATIVGETTGGAGDLGVFHRIDDHFGMGIPAGKIVNPYSMPDWAGTGVEPDIEVRAADALATAEKLASEGHGK